MMKKFKDFALAVLFYVVAAFLVFLIVLSLIHSDDTQKEYDRLYEEHTALEEKYEEVSTTLDNVYSSIYKTMDGMSVLYDYFEEQSISFDEAYASYDELSSILHPYY